MSLQGHEPPTAKSVFYGWYIVAALAITETVSYGVLFYAFSVFITPMENDLGWSRAELTGAFSLALLVSAVISIPAGNWLDKYGARALMSIGSIAAMILIMAWAGVNNLTSFYLVWFGLGMTMAMLFYDPAFTVIAKWFNRQRSRALTIVTLVAGFASTIFLPLTNTLVQTQGWRGAILILALILGVITIPLHLLILRRTPADMGLYLDGADAPPKRKTGTHQKPDSSIGQALRNPALWWMILAFALVMLAASAIRVHFIPLMLDRGFDGTFAAWIAGLIGVMQVVGRLVFTPLETRIGTKRMTIVVFGLQMLMLGLLLFPSSDESIIIIFVGGFGASVGMSTLIRPALLANLFGTAHYGRINSVMAFFMILAGTAAPVGAGILYEQSGDYQSTLVYAVILTGIAILALTQLSTGRSPVQSETI